MSPLRIARRCLAALAAAALLAVAGFTGASLPGATPAAAAGDGLAAYRTQVITWQPCGPRDKAECGTYLVPRDYAKPKGATVRVGVSRVKATGTRIGSLLFNPGGPGGSGSSWVISGISAFPKDLRRSFDIIGFDARGVGRGDQIRCFTAAEWNAEAESDYPVTQLDAQALLDDVSAFAARCDDLSPGLRSRMSTVAVARDMDILRSVLGEPKTNYLGISFGTYIGAVYASLFPTSVGRFVLDSNMSPTVDIVGLSEAQASSFQDSLLRWSRWCRTRAGCPYTGSAKRIMASVTAEIEAMMQNPLPVKKDDPATYDEMMGMLESLLSWGQDSGTAKYDGWDYLLVTLIDIHDGKGDTLRALTNAFDEGDRVSINSASANWAVNCRERGVVGSISDAFTRAETWAKAYPTFGRWNAWGQASTCSVWPGVAADRVQPLPVPATIPGVLLFGGTHDPNTPLAWTYEMQATLPGSRVVVWQGDGHSATLRGESCTDGTMSRFLTTGTLPADGKTC